MTMAVRTSAARSYVRSSSSWNAQAPSCIPSTSSIPHSRRRKGPAAAPLPASVPIAFSKCFSTNPPSYNAAASKVETSAQEDKVVGESSTKLRKTLADLIADSIKASGPISVATFMRTALLDPSQGYYASANATEAGEGARDVLGAKGDFITSPEISQVFGELLAVYFVARWQAVGSPQNVRLVEFGPGKGTLLADMIRTFARFPILKSLKSIHLVETSDGLMRLQLKAIEGALHAAGKKIAMPTSNTSTASTPSSALKEDEVSIEYFPLVDAVPLQPDQWTMLVAHEFFDALPIHVFEKTMKGFREVLIDVKSQHGTEGDLGGTTRQLGQSGVTTIKVSDLRRNRSSTNSPSGGTASASSPPTFQYVLSPTETPWTKLLVSSNPRFQSLQPGQRVEISPESWATARKIGELVSGKKAKVPEGASKVMGRSVDDEQDAEEVGESRGGAGLIIDYGDEKAFGGSFRAFKSHSIVSPLVAPGQADLTSNVDFSYLKNALSTTSSRAMGIMFQSHFLHALGLGPRVEALVKSINTEDEQGRKRSRDIESSAKRLIDPTGMGGQYKVLGVEGNDAKDVWPFDFEDQLRSGTKGERGEEQKNKV